MANIRRRVKARSLHVYGDLPLFDRIKSMAEAEGTSMNLVAMRALRAYFGADPMPRYQRQGPARQKRRENGSGQRVQLRAMVSPEINESVRALASARGCSVAMIVNESLEQKFSSWGAFASASKDKDTQ